MEPNSSPSAWYVSQFGHIIQKWSNVEQNWLIFTWKCNYFQHVVICAATRLIQNTLCLFQFKWFKIENEKQVKSISFHDFLPATNTCLHILEICHVHSQSLMSRLRFPHPNVQSKGKKGKENLMVLHCSTCLICEPFGVWNSKEVGC